MQSPSHPSGQHEAVLGDISPVIAPMKGEHKLPDSLAAHAKCYTNVAAGETESRGLFAAPSTALHILVGYRVARLQHVGCSVLSRTSTG